MVRIHGDFGRHFGDGVGLVPELDHRRLLDANGRVLCKPGSSAKAA